MKKILEITLFTSVLFYAIFLILFTTNELLKVPESPNKTLAITLAIPLIGAVFTGIVIELFRFIIDRREKEGNRKKEKYISITNKAISLSLNIIQTKKGVEYANIGQFTSDLNELIALIVSETDTKTLKSIEPLLDLLHREKDKPSAGEYRTILGNMIVNVRRSFGYLVDDDTSLIIRKGIL